MIRHQQEVGTSCFDLVSTVANPGGNTVALTEPTDATQFHRPLRSDRRQLIWDSIFCGIPEVAHRRRIGNSC